MSSIPTMVLVLWAVLGVAILIAVGFCIRAEGRWFAGRGKRSSWLTLRICTVPIAIATAGVVVIVTRMVSGPEALAAFFVLLFTVAPLMYFGMHWIAARWLQPRLTGGEIAWVGFSGLMAIFTPPAFLSAANTWVFMIAHGFGMA